MDTNKLTQTLKSLLDRISNDPQLDDEGKSDLVDLINDVIAEPTPNNLEALALVIEELGKSQEYMAALEIVNEYNSPATQEEE